MTVAPAGRGPRRGQGCLRQARCAFIRWLAARLQRPVQGSCHSAACWSGAVRRLTGRLALTLTRSLMALSVVFATHSTTLDNERGVATGWLPGEWSRTRTFTGGGAWSAPLRTMTSRRCSVPTWRGPGETARIAFAGSSVPVLLDWRLPRVRLRAAKRDAGRRAACGAEELALEPCRIPAGRAGGKRVARVGSGSWRTCARRWDGRRVLVIGHAATRWGLHHRLNGTPLELTRRRERRVAKRLGVPARLTRDRRSGIPKSFTAMCRKSLPDQGRPSELGRRRGSGTGKTGSVAAELAGQTRVAAELARKIRGAFSLVPRQARPLHGTAGSRPTSATPGGVLR